MNREFATGEYYERFYIFIEKGRGFFVINGNNPLWPMDHNIINIIYKNNVDDKNYLNFTVEVNKDFSVPFDTLRSVLAEMGHFISDNKEK